MPFDSYWWPLRDSLLVWESPQINPRLNPKSWGTAFAPASVLPCWGSCFSPISQYAEDIHEQINRLFVSNNFSSWWMTLTTRSKNNLMSEGDLRFITQPWMLCDCQSQVYTPCGCCSSNQYRQKLNWTAGWWWWWWWWSHLPHCCGWQKKGDTWLILSTCNQKMSLWRGLLRMKVSQISTRPLLMHHRRCVCRNLMTSAPFHAAVTASNHAHMSLRTWHGYRIFFQTFSSDVWVMERQRQQQQRQQRGGRSSTVPGGDPAGAPLLSRKLQILTGGVEKPCCLNWERQT